MKGKVRAYVQLQPTNLLKCCYHIEGNFRGSNTGNSGKKLSNPQFLNHQYFPI